MPDDPAIAFLIASLALPALTAQHVVARRHRDLAQAERIHRRKRRRIRYRSRNDRPKA